MYELCNIFLKLCNTYQVRGDDLYSMKIHSRVYYQKMKIMIFLVALTIPLMSGIMFTDYQPSTQKKEDAQANVQDAKQDLNEAQKDTNAVVQKVANTKEWKTFNKSDFELKFKANEMRITKLNVKIRKSAELFYEFYLQKIANLEKENRFLKARLEAYEKSRSNLGSI